jgi:hypothetical protein
LHAALGSCKRGLIVVVQRPRSLAELETLREEIRHLDPSTVGAIVALVILSVVIGAACYVLVPAERVWLPIRPYWIPLPLILVPMCVLLVPYIWLAKEAKERRAKRSLYEAIAGYDKAVLAYARYKATNDSRLLKESYSHISKGMLYLTELPEYCALRIAIEKDYDLICSK